MPSVDVSSFITGLNPIRHTSSYTMPVVSPHRGTSSTYTGSYRSTFSSSSIDRPYTSSTPRSYSYSGKYSSRSTYSTDDTKSYTRHASIAEDGISRYRDESRDTSSKRDSLSRDSGFRDGTSTRSNSLRDSYGRDSSLTRSDITRSSRSELSSFSTLDSVADLRSKYSPSNYIPLVLRKSDYGRSKSIGNDIGKPPIERSEPKAVKLKKEVETVETLREETITEDENSATKTDTESAGIASVTWALPSETSSMEVSDTTKVFNHTTNFASYIPSKEINHSENEAMNEGDDSDMESSENNTSDIFCQQRSAINDLTTSPRLNRTALTQNSVASSSTSPTVNNLIPNSVQRASPITSRDDDRTYDRTLGTSSIKSQGLNGLKNIGNTCFMNSVIQCLSNTRYLMEYVRGDAFMADINTTISGMKGSLIKAFSQVIQELWSTDSTDRVVNTLSLKSQIQRFAPRFMGYSQQDAQEFLRYLLEGLHEDVNRVTTKPTPIHTEIDEKLSDSQKAAEAWQRYLRCDNSRVVDIFVGQLKSTLRCTHCGHCSVTFDPFWDLSLPIPQKMGPLRLQQCLEHFTREETLDGDEKPTCSKCKERRKCTKSFSIQKFPKILVIHLKRFSPTERFRGKLNHIIDFPLSGLDLSYYAATTGHSDCVYNLYAVSNHSGTTYSGHYTAYCKHPYSQQWHEYNDSRVSTISQRYIVSSTAYVLFYELAEEI